MIKRANQILGKAIIKEGNNLFKVGREPLGIADIPYKGHDWLRVIEYVPKDHGEALKIVSPSIEADIDYTKIEKASGKYTLRMNGRIEEGLVHGALYLDEDACSSRLFQPLKGCEVKLVLKTFPNCGRGVQRYWIIGIDQKKEPIRMAA